MDEENQINEKYKIKRELTNTPVKKYRKKKCTESQQLNSLMLDDLPRKCKARKLREIMANEREQWQRNVREVFVRKNVLMSYHKICSSCGFIVFTSDV